MARLKNDLYQFLVGRNIFKRWERSDTASDDTIARREERNRGKLVWLSVGYRTNLQTGIRNRVGKGTYIYSKHGELK